VLGSREMPVATFAVPVSFDPYITLSLYF